MADGRIARFEVPDGTTPEQAQTLITDHLKTSGSPDGPSASPAVQPPDQPAAPQPQDHGLAASALTGYGDMASFGFLDEAQGALRASMPSGDQRPWKERYADYRDDSRKASDEMWQQNPKAYGAGAVVGAVATPGLGTAKGASMLGKVAPRLAGTPAKAAALAAAPLGALNAAGTADSTDGIGLKMVGGAALGAAGGAVAGKAVDLLVNPYLTRWARNNNVSEDVTKAVADRFASYTARDPDAAKIGPNATRVTNSVLKDLQTEIGTYFKKAQVTEGVDVGDLKAAATIISKTGQKNAVHSTDDVALIHKVFGDDADDVLHRIDQADTISTHMGSMKEIIGPIAHGIESRNSSGNILDLVNAATLGALKSGNRVVQRLNPVNQLAKRGNAGRVPDPQIVRDEITDAVKAAKAAKDAANAQLKLEAAARKAAKEAAALKDNRIKLNNKDLDYPVASSEGWRGNARDQVFNRSGIEVTNRELNRATADTLTELANRPGMTKEALKKLGAGANTASNADRSVLAGVVRRLNATRDPMPPSGAGRPPTGAPVAVDGRGNPLRNPDNYNDAVKGIKGIQDEGFTFTNPSGNPREYLVTAPDGTDLGSVPDSATALKLINLWKAKQ
jgi:hypothetical protein